MRVNSVTFALLGSLLVPLTSGFAPVATTRPTFVHHMPSTTVNGPQQLLHFRAHTFLTPTYRPRGHFRRGVLHYVALEMVNEEIELVTMEAEDRMAKSLESVKKNMMTIRTGRANARMLDRVEVPYYGVATPLPQMATIAVPSAQQLSVSPFDKSCLGDVEKAIIESGLGLTPNNDGSMIRINIPQLTEDRRKDMMKQCKAIGEEGKVAVRNIRRDGVDSIKKMEKAKDAGEDEAADGLDEMQAVTDRFVKQIDAVVADKEKEVMTV